MNAYLLLEKPCGWVMSHDKRADHHVPGGLPSEEQRRAVD